MRERGAVTVMWFRPGSSSSGEDRFRVSSFRSRIRGRKPSSAVATAAIPEQPVKGGGKQSIARDGQRQSSGGQSSEKADTSTTSAGTESSTNDSIEIPQDAINQMISDSATSAATVVVVPLHDEDEEQATAVLEQKEIKDQVILTDPKYKSNRIEKSSSRSRVVPLSTRKISAPPVMESKAGSLGSPSGSSPVTGSGTSVVAPKKNARSHSHLNLNSLLKYKSLLYAGGDKKLTTEDFDKMRKKSMSEVAKAAQPNSDATNSVKLIRHELIDELDDANCDKKKATTTVGSLKMSLSDKVAAKLNESKKKRSKSKTRKRRNSRRSSCNNSAANIPTVLANKLAQGDRQCSGEVDSEGEAEIGKDGSGEEGQEMFSLGWWISYIAQGIYKSNQAFSRL